jgi:hypothetical protein
MKIIFSIKYFRYPMMDNSIKRHSSKKVMFIKPLFDIYETKWLIFNWETIFVMLHNSVRLNKLLIKSNTIVESRKQLSLSLTYFFMNELYLIGKRSEEINYTIKFFSNLIFDTSGTIFLHIHLSCFIRISWFGWIDKAC